MKFLFLIHGDETAEAALTGDELRAIVDAHMAYGAMLRDRGAYVLGEVLEIADCSKSWGNPMVPP